MLALDCPDHLQLRCLYTAGEALHRGGSVGTPYRLVNAYGPTESYVITMYDVPHGMATAPSIGSPVPHGTVYVLDKRMEPAPIGVFGDLYLGGAQLARGYFNRPDLTAERFLPNPFVEGGRIYKTGDIVRWRSDGNLEYLGRADSQVKIRGFRIEMGEVEAALLAMERVAEACAIAREDTPGDKRLVAYVVPNAPNADAAEPLTVSDLRVFMKDKLPGFMVPSAFVILDTMPLTANQKIDRRSLPAPDAKDMEDGDYVAPRNPTEELLAEIWGKTLRLDRVSVHATFFELGGHSLSAAQMMAKIRAAFNVDVPLSLLFDSPSVAGMSEGLTLLQAKARAHEQRCVEESKYLSLSFQAIYSVNLSFQAFVGEVFALTLTLFASSPLRLFTSSPLRLPPLFTELESKRGEH